MAPEPEGVCPVAELQVSRVPACPPRSHAVVTRRLRWGRTSSVDQVRLPQLMVEAAECVGRLGGVLGDVGSHRPGCHRVESDLADVDLLAPPDLAGDAFARGI